MPVVTPEQTGATDAPTKNRKGGVVVPHRPTWYQRLGAWGIFLLVRGVGATLRYSWTDRSGFFDKPLAGPVIYCAWHNRLALSMQAYAGYARRRNKTSGLAVLVSASKDGGFLAAIFETFGVHPVRGSSSRRGPQALRELTSWVERGYDIAITPDGPRGPRYAVQDGVMALAQITGLPIIPASYYLSRKIRFKSWDRFQVPLPFSRCAMIIGEPVRVPREASDAEREVLRKKLEAELRSITRD